jgi:AcrR family transcriptional regulator
VDASWPIVTVEVPRRLPRGVNALPRDVVAVSQLARLAEGMARVVAHKGYAKVTIGDICTAAGVSRSTFYAYFDDKEAAYLACYAAAADRQRAALDAAAGAGGSPAEVLRRLVHAYLDVLVRAPVEAAAFFAESDRAGETAHALRIAHREWICRMFERWHETVRAWRPEVTAPPADAWRLAAGGADELLLARIRAGAGHTLHELEVPIGYTLLAVAGLADLAAESAPGDARAGAPVETG